jgi:hypothetical protein
MTGAPKMSERLNEIRERWKDDFWMHERYDAGFELLEYIAALEAELSDARAKASAAVTAYDKANPLRLADFHVSTCGCLRCAVDNLRSQTP